MRARHIALSLATAGAIAGGIFTVRQSTLAESPAAVEAQASNGKAVGTAEDLSSAFRRVGKIVEPSVVNIKVKKVVEAPPQMRGRGPTMPFRHFFGPNGNGNGDGFPDMPDFGDGQMPFGGEQIGQGSGVIVAVDGKTAYIVTNNHVAGDADEITVVLNDGRTIENGTLVGADAKTDVAVVKIEADNLKAANWGNSDDLEKGDWVLAFGSPFGYVGSMTHGVVSATNRTNMGIIPQGYENFIQIDAPINPGNSGGPLTNIHGEVVGINTAIASRTGGFQGIGFAIPSNQAKQIYEIIRTKGKVVRGWLGVKIASVTEEETAPVAKYEGYTAPHGVFVHETYPDTPAFGKLQNGDVITAINGKEVSDSGALRNAIAMMAPGTDVKLDVFRGGKSLSVTIKLGDQPANLTAMGPGQSEPQEEEHAAASADHPRLGVALEDATPEVMQQAHMARTTKGALITRVAPGSPAAHAGLRPGDVITKIGNDGVTSADGAIAAIKKADLKKGVPLYVMSQEGGRFVYVQAVPEHAKTKKSE